MLLLFVILFGWMAVSGARAATYYVALDGKPDNDGSREKPWPSVEYALVKVGGGQTIVVRPGVYLGPIWVPKTYAGTQEHPTILRSEVKWKATIVGSPVHGISNGDNCNWLVVDGFEVLGARYDGVKMSGDHNTVRNCWVHNNAGMGVAMHDKKDGLIENNLIEFNGSHIQFHHGIYADGDGLIVRNNIVRHNAGFGIHLYPSMQNARVVNNLVYGHPYKPGIIVACPADGGKNIIANNTVADNRIGIEIWSGDGEVIANNIISGTEQPIEFDSNTRNVYVDYNLCTHRSARQGPHGLTGDPRFVDAERGAFWLLPDSPAIGKGTSRYAPATDFWGRPLLQSQAPDLGAFPFLPSLATPQARATWYEHWAYSFAPLEKLTVPDLWAVPK